jgi:hypothetical protein
MKAYGGIGDIAPLILNLRTRWRQMIIFMLQLLYVLGKEALVPID